MGVASLVLGIICVVLCWIPVWNWVGIALGVVGVVLGAIGKKKAKEKGEGGGTAAAGFVLSIIGLAIAVGAWLACFACASAL